MIANFKIRTLEFTSLFSYTSRPESADPNILQYMRNTKTWTAWLKQDRMVYRSGSEDEGSLPMTRYIAETLYDNINEKSFLNVFDQYTVLIPVPRSNPLPPGGLWVPKRIAEEMVDKGIGGEVMLSLKRVKTVNRSSQSIPSQRPLPSEHYESLLVEKSLTMSNKVVLIDDVITRGATLIAAANKLIDTYPKIQILSFAAIRTISNSSEFSRWFDPVRGTVMIRSQQGDTIRRP